MTSTAYLRLAAVAAWVAFLAPLGCADPPVADEEEAGGVRPVRPARVESELTRGDTLPHHPSWTRQDYEILAATVRWARREGVDTLPMGERVARIGETFLGTPYVPQTLDPPGPERLVVNLRGMDCVTFVESALALAHVVRMAPSDAFLDDAVDARAVRLYEDVLLSLRYRGGHADGYASRLHYFSEWIQDNQARGAVTDVTRELGGEPDPEPVTFMTRHVDAYRQLGDPTVLHAVAGIEAALSSRPRYVIPQERVADVEAGIRTGDIIAATSTLEGLDVAHTGIAVWRNGVLRLMHAPLVGEAVQLSEEALAPRLLGLSRQDGLMVARPEELTAPPRGLPDPGR
ncbi:MAG TPA: N-acetylmuramoyl-L-alanine amidase-like domain-containing protein [Longimicrobiales bacterium]|jgi:hypothetical protein